MRNIAFLTLCVCAWAVMIASASQPVDYEKNWHQWRGPHATGAAASDANPPLTWSETENVRWKIAIPRHGARHTDCMGRENLHPNRYPRRGAESGRTG